MRNMCEEGGGGGRVVVVEVVVNIVVVVVALLVVEAVVEVVSSLVVDVNKVVVVGLAKNFLVDPTTLPTVGKFGVIFFVAKFTVGMVGMAGIFLLKT